MRNARSAIDRALAHPSLREFAGMIPAAARSNPQELRTWFAAAASIDPAGAQSNGVFKGAYAAVTQWAASAALEDRVARAFHDPRLVAEFGEARLEAAWKNPQAAYEELVTKSASGRLSSAASEALQVLSEVRQVAAEDGASWEQPGAPPVPDSAGVKREAAALVEASTERRLTPREHQRLLQLYEARVADDEAAEARRGPPPTPETRPQTRREQLLERYATTGLSKAESAELTSIYKEAYGEADPAEVFDDVEAYADE